jgi:hypothetical protein
MKQIILSILLVATPCVGIFGQKRLDSHPSAPSAPFRYVIVHNEVDPALTEEDAPRRFVEVVADRRTFTRKNLLGLVKLVSARFQNPTLLYVNVFTDLADVQTPEERDDGQSLSERAITKNPQPSATFVRLADGKSRLIITFAGRHEEIEVK